MRGIINRIDSGVYLAYCPDVTVVYYRYVLEVARTGVPAKSVSCPGEIIACGVRPCRIMRGQDVAAQSARHKYE